MQSSIKMTLLWNGWINHPLLAPLSHAGRSLGLLFTLHWKLATAHVYLVMSSTCFILWMGHLYRRNHKIIMALKASEGSRHSRLPQNPLATNIFSHFYKSNNWRLTTRKILFQNLAVSLLSSTGKRSLPMSRSWILTIRLQYRDCGFHYT